MVRRKNIWDLRSVVCTDAGPTIGPVSVIPLKNHLPLDQAPTIAVRAVRVASGRRVLTN
jgi:hypothetical protein